MTPTIGRIVHYRLYEEEADKMNARRQDTQNNRDRMREERPGFQAHVGNPVAKGEIVPMIIVAVFGSDGRVNGQAFFDGNDSLWVTSATEGDQPGQWCWPPRTGSHER